MLSYYDRNFNAVFVPTADEARGENAAKNRAVNEERNSMELSRDWCNTWTREERSPFGPNLGATPKPFERSVICDVDMYKIQR